MSSWHELAAHFRERNSSIYCRDLVGHDLSIPEEREKARQEGVFATTCNKCISDAAELLEQALQD